MIVFFFLGENREELRGTYIQQKIDIPLCKQIACGYDFSICLTENNLLFSFGSNFCSLLGVGTSGENQFTPIQVFQGNENIWGSLIGKSKQKSARK